jgi:hypothetical protein
MRATERNIYVVSGLVDRDKMREYANGRLTREDTESTLHYHRFSETCGGHEHEQFLRAEVVEK